jgi:hypothetical protein
MPAGVPSVAERRKKAAIENAIRAIEQLSSSVPTAVRTDLEATAGSLRQKESVTEAQALAIEIMVAVQQANKKVEAQLERVEQIRLELLGVETEAAAEGYEWLGQVQAGRAPMEDLRLQSLEQMLAGANASAHNEYIAEATESILMELGYEVEVGFVNAVADGGKAMARKSGWPNHVLVVDRDDGRLVWKLRRTESIEVGVGFDREAQTEFCEDYERITTAMTDRGLTFDTANRTPPGVVASLVVDRPPGDFVSRRREAERLRERDFGGAG